MTSFPNYVNHVLKEEYTLSQIPIIQKINTIKSARKRHK
jgi:hypothetical protein